jgi:hypothetical protein
MKSFSFLILFIMTAALATGQTSALLTTFRFEGIEEGYDHMCKTQVWINGELAGESAEVKESKGGSFTVNVPYGEHRMRIVNLAQFEGQWEEHTVEKNYSIDCLWEGVHKFDQKSSKLFLLFDLDGGTTMSWKKMPKKAKS